VVLRPASKYWFKIMNGVTTCLWVSVISQPSNHLSSSRLGLIFIWFVIIWVLAESTVCVFLYMTLIEVTSSFDFYQWDVCFYFNCFIIVLIRHSTLSCPRMPVLIFICKNVSSHSLICNINTDSTKSVTIDIKGGNVIIEK